MSNETSIPAVTGAPRLILRLEGLALLAGAVFLYFHLGHDGARFALLLLVPDLSLLGYLAGPAIGALLYNAAHSTLGPALLALAGILWVPAALPLALIWFAHVGMDRALGYGLKYRSAFRATHLGLVGRS